jgi:hypothetical protein
VLTVILSACSGYIRVDNASDNTFYLQFEHEAVWRIPPHTSGVGPTNAGPSNKLVQILDEDCHDLGRWGLQQTETITIDASGALSVATGATDASPLPRADGACPIVP